MLIAFLIASILSFLTTYLSVKWLIKYLRKVGMVVPDMNKKDKPLIPISGGLAVMSGIFIGLMFFIFLQTFFYKDNSFSLILFGAITTIVLITFIGFVDDALIERNSSSSSGLKQWQKPLLVLPAAIPLVVINAAITKINLPWGNVDLGIIYPLLIIPIGVVGAANMVNNLAGFNGLETGMGIIYTLSLGIYAYSHGSVFAALIAFLTFAALIAFFIFNKYPAKILPGDSLTYLLGAIIAVIAILGNMEKTAIIISIPFIIEFFLKIRAKLRAHSYGYYKDGKIQSYYANIYSIPHIFSRTGRFTEKQITYFIICIEVIFSSLIWLI